ncbi:MAG: ferrochelatase [Rhabdochlamydiaceae bacterium]|nr:ferrochelatase [Candidatus Amphrikana amoebophyrae]
MKRALLLVNLGTPDSPNKKDVKRYLNEFLLDPDVLDIPWALRQILVRRIIVPRRAPFSSKMYQGIWTDKGSPLMFHTQDLAEEMAKLLEGEIDVDFAMRYQNPSLKNVLSRFEKKGVEEILLLPLFPQYARATSGSIISRVAELTSKWKKEPKVSVIKQFATMPEMIETFAKNGSEAHNYDHVLFSFHGLPQKNLISQDPSKRCLASPNCCENRPLSDNCYRAHCLATANAIVKKLDLDSAKYTVCFQSRLGRKEWLKPYALETMESLVKNGVKSLLVFSPSFVCDCLETLHEIEIEFKEEFIKMGGTKLDLVPSLNLDPIWVKGLANLVIKQLSPGQASLRCLSHESSH